MNEHEIIPNYYRWLCSFVCDDAANRYHIENYKKLLHELFVTPFKYQKPLDANRYSDGINMRYRFGNDFEVPDAIIASTLDIQDCSLLEMFVAMAYRCENQLMYDNTSADRTGEWFWDMIESLKLTAMTDYQYDDKYTTTILKIFNDSGILFDVSIYGYEASYDIWWQLNRHLIGKEGV